MRVPIVPTDAKPEEVIKELNELIQEFNFLSTKMALSNFDGQIVENFKMSAGAEVTVPHSLGVIPKYRLILRQEGNGVISDIPSGWTKSSIKLKNNGAVEVIATIFLVRE